MNRLFMYFKIILPCDCEIAMVTRMNLCHHFFSMLFFFHNCEDLKLNKFTSLIQSIKFKLTLNFKSGNNNFMRFQLFIHACQCDIANIIFWPKFLPETILKSLIKNDDLNSHPLSKIKPQSLFSKEKASKFSL